MKKHIIFLSLFCILGLFSCQNRPNYINIKGYAQGGVYSITLNKQGKDEPIRLSDEEIKLKIDSIFNHIDTTLSGYNKNSMVTKFNHGNLIIPNKMFRDMYNISYKYWGKSNGYLDFACSKLYDLWGFGFTNDSLPSNKVIKELLDSIGMDNLRDTMPIGPITNKDLLLKSKINLLAPQLNYNAIAQGYSCDVIADFLYKLGAKDFLIDVGEIYCDGVNRYGKPWRIGVDRPFDGNNNPGQDLDGIWESNTHGQGIVTSGNYRKFYIKNGKKYSHTINPKTGYPVNHNLLSATIVAPNATMADAYATYCMVIGLDAAKKFILNNPDLEGYLIFDDENGKMSEWASPKFNLK